MAKKTVYSFRDGLALVTVAATLANVNPKTKAADVVDASGSLLVKGAPFSEKPADGCWSEITEYVPGPPEPDKDAKIADLESEIAALKAEKAAQKDGHKDKKS